MTDQPQLASDAPGESSLREYLLVFLLFLMLASAYTYPLVSNLSSHFPDSNATVDTASDATLQIWYSWWVQKAILSLQDSLLYSDWIFYPHGMEMTMQPAMFLHGAMTVPFFWLNITTAVNIVILLSFALSGLTAFLLGRYLFQSVPAALFCGFIYALCPSKLQHLEGHYQLMATETLPLVALSLVRLFDLPSRRHLIWAGIWLGATVYTDYYYFAYALLLGGVIILYRTAVSDRRVVTIRHAIVAGLIAFVVASPLLVPALISASRSDYAIASGHDKHKVDLLSFFVPSQRQWISQPLSPLTDHLDMEAIDGIEHSVYIGWALLILCAVYCRRVWRQEPHARLFALIAGLFCLLAMGPHLSINGHEVWGASEWKIPLPGMLLAEAPLLKGARAPARIFIVGALGLAVLGGFALRQLLREGRVFGIRAQHAAAGVVGLTALEFVMPVGMAAMHTPPWVDMIKSDPEPGIVAHLPMRPMRFPFWQTQFDRKMMLAKLGRIDPDISQYYWRNNALRILTAPGLVVMRPVKAEASFLVDLMRIRYVTVDRTDPPLDRITMGENLLASTYGFEQVYEDSAAALYRYPGDFRVVQQLRLDAKHDAFDLVLLYGWSNRRLFEGTRLAWMIRDEAVVALPPMDSATGYQLSLQFTTRGPESLSLDLSIGDHDLGTHLIKRGTGVMQIPIARSLLHDAETNLLRIKPHESVGLPHDTGIMEYPAPYGVPIRVTSQGLATRGEPRSEIIVSNQRFYAQRPGLMVVHLDSTGQVVSEFFEHLTEGYTVQALETYIRAAPLSATVLIANNGSSDLLGGHINEALTCLGIPESEAFNWLNSLAIVGARDGRPPIIDTGPAQAEIVLGRTVATKEAAVGLSALHLTPAPQ